MINLSVQADTQRIKAKLFELRDNVINKALPRALNRVAAQAKVAGSRAIKAKLKNVKAAAIKRRIVINKATIAKPYVVIRGLGACIPPSAFKIPGHGDEMWMRYGGGKHHNVVAKTGKNAGKIISSYTNIKRVPNLQVAQAYRTKEVQQAMTDIVRTKFADSFEHELKYYGKR
jgi:hypothetical protein